MHVYEFTQQYIVRAQMRDSLNELLEWIQHDLRINYFPSDRLGVEKSGMFLN